MLHVVLDANVFISYVLARDEAQQELGETLADAAILAFSIAHGYSLATFDRGLAQRAKTFGITPYW